MSRQPSNGYDPDQAVEDEANAAEARGIAFEPKSEPASQPPAETPEASDTKKAADAIDRDDPHKVEKLSKLGSAGEEAAEGTE